MSKYLNDVLNFVKEKYNNEPEYVQAVTEVLLSLEPVISKNEEYYRKNALLERLVEPERIISFRVP